MFAYKNHRNFYDRHNFDEETRWKKPSQGRELFLNQKSVVSKMQIALNIETKYA